MAQINKRYANLVSEIDEISEICDREGHSEVCALLDEVAEELATAPVTAPKQAKHTAAPKRTAASKELRDVAKALYQSGNVREARNVIRVADEMDLGLESEEALPGAEEDLDGGLPESGGCVPCPTCGAEPPQPDQAPEEGLEEMEPMDSLDEEPSTDQVAASMRILERKLAKFRGAEDTNELAEKALSKAESEAKKNLGKDPEASKSAPKSAAKKLLAEIDALEAQLAAKPVKAVKAKSAPSASAKAARTVREVARKLDQDGQRHLARRVRGLLG